MPIRINLLAEAQALEEMRRKDPVKRTVWIGAGLVAVVLVWSSSLQLKAIILKGEVNSLESEAARHNTQYQAVVQNQKKLTDVTTRLTSLNKLACNRLLYGTFLNGLQQVTVDDVQLTRLRVDQSYTRTEETKAKVDPPAPAKPATVTEHIVVTLEARDSGLNPGDQVNRYKAAIADSPYFQSATGKTNEVRLASLSPPNAAGGKPYVQFTLESKYPEKTR